MTYVVNIVELIAAAFSPRNWKRLAVSIGQTLLEKHSPPCTQATDDVHRAVVHARISQIALCKNGKQLSLEFWTLRTVTSKLDKHTINKPFNAKDAKILTLGRVAASTAVRDSN